ncbi:ABC transporter permease [Segnochrobactraceae bacterium EtOH-i3]
MPSLIRASASDGASVPARWAGAIVRHPGLAIGTLVLVVVLAAAIAAPVLGTVDPNRLNPMLRLKPPSASAWFGTDRLGRDIYSRVLFGARVSLIVGVSVAVLVTALGLTVGLLAGFLKRADSMLMRLMDALMSIPAVLLAIALMSLTKASVGNVIFVVALGELPAMARLVRSVVLSLRERPYVDAAITSGTRLPLLLVRHILPNTVSILLVQGTFVFASAMILEAVLSFVGAGTPPDVPSWGAMIADARGTFQIAPYTVLFPALALSLTVLSVNMVGNGLQAVLDRQARR